MLRRLFKKYLIESGVDENHIIEMSFDLFANKPYRDPEVFHPWAIGQIKDDEKYYFLLDEVQMLDEFVSVLNGLTDIKNYDVYVTGSNARFLSRDILTEFGGRGDEVHMFPLSFSEFMTVYGGDKYNGWNEYITYGGIQPVVMAPTEEQKMKLLDNLLQGTYIKDIVVRNKVRNARIGYRQQEATHSMENAIYNELRMRGFRVDVGNIQVPKK